MNFSEKTKHIADNCRFCWMCHHICPVGNATGQERNTARARALAISLAYRGGAEVTPDMIDNMYECTLCGGCTNDCVTGFDPIVFVKEIRNEAAMNGLLPKYIEKMLDNYDACGNIYGVKSISDGLKNIIMRHSEKSNTLLFLGCDARYKMAENAADAVQALELGQDRFTLLENEPDSGYSFDTIIGAAAETVEIMKNCAKVLNGYAEVIVYDPADAKIFTREYKEYGIELNCKITTFTKKCSEYIANGRINPINSGKTCTYQDPALLVREVGEQTEPRDIIRSYGVLTDMMLCGKQTMFAGNLIMSEYIPDTMKLIAEKRWENALSTGAGTLVTASVSEYAVMKSVKPDNMKICTIEQLMLGKEI